MDIKMGRVPEQEMLALPTTMKSPNLPCCLSVLLFTSSCLLIICGCGMVITALYLYFDPLSDELKGVLTHIEIDFLWIGNYYDWTKRYPYSVFGVAVFVILNGAAGCYLACVKDVSLRVLTLYTISVFIFSSTISSGITLDEDLQKELTGGLIDDITKDYPTSNLTRQNFHKMFSKLECCGMRNYTEVLLSDGYLPEECCGRTTSVSCTSENAYPGCDVILEQHFEYYDNILDFLGLGSILLKMLKIVIKMNSEIVKKQTQMKKEKRLENKEKQLQEKFNDLKRRERLITQKEKRAETYMYRETTATTSFAMPI